VVELNVTVFAKIDQLDAKDTALAAKDTALDEKGNVLLCIPLLETII
jgi:hypothetical protein